MQREVKQAVCELQQCLRLPSLPTHLRQPRAYISIVWHCFTSVDAFIRSFLSALNRHRAYTDGSGDVYSNKARYHKGKTRFQFYIWIFWWFFHVWTSVSLFLFLLLINLFIPLSSICFFFCLTNSPKRKDSSFTIVNKERQHGLLKLTNYQSKYQNRQQFFFFLFQLTNGLIDWSLKLYLWVWGGAVDGRWRPKGSVGLYGIVAGCWWQAHVASHLLQWSRGIWVISSLFTCNYYPLLSSLCPGQSMTQLHVNDDAK